MNKLIVKTALITLAVLLAVSSMIYLCFALFAPSKMSEFYDGLGSGELSLHYAERAYEKSGEEGDLLIVVRRAVAAKIPKKPQNTVPFCLKNSPISFRAKSLLIININTALLCATAARKIPPLTKPWNSANISSRATRLKVLRRTVLKRKIPSC